MAPWEEVRPPIQLALTEARSLLPTGSQATSTRNPHTLPPLTFSFFCLLLGQALPVETVSFILVTLLNFKCFMALSTNVARIIVLFIYRGPELSCWQFQTRIQMNDGPTYNPHWPLGNIHTCASLPPNSYQEQIAV